MVKFHASRQGLNKHTQQWVDVANCKCPCHSRLSARARATAPGHGSGRSTARHHFRRSTAGYISRHSAARHKSKHSTTGESTYQKVQRLLRKDSSSAPKLQRLLTTLIKSSRSWQQLHHYLTLFQPHLNHIHYTAAFTHLTSLPLHSTPFQPTSTSFQPISTPFHPSSTASQQSAQLEPPLPEEVGPLVLSLEPSQQCPSTDRNQDLSPLPHASNGWYIEDSGQALPAHVQQPPVQLGKRPAAGAATGKLQEVDTAAQQVAAGTQEAAAAALEAPPASVGNEMSPFPSFQLSSAEQLSDKVDFAERLSGCLVLNLDCVDARGLANMLWAHAVMQIHPVDSQKFLEACLSRMEEFCPQQLCNMLWAAASLKLRPSQQWLSSYLETSKAAMSECTLQGLAQMAWALASLGIQPDSTWMHAFCLACLTRLEQQDVSNCTPQTVSMTLWSLAKLQYSPNFSLLDLYLDFLNSHGWDQCSPQCLSNISWALATLHYPPSPEAVEGFLAATKQLLRRVAGDGNCTGMGGLAGAADMVSNLGWAVATLLLRPGRTWMELYAAACQVCMPHFSGTAFSNVGWALVRLDYYPCPHWMCAYLKHSQDKLHTFAPWSLALTSWSLARFYVMSSSQLVHAAPPTQASMPVEPFTHRNLTALPVPQQQPGQQCLAPQQEYVQQCQPQQSTQAQELMASVRSSGGARITTGQPTPPAAASQPSPPPGSGHPTLPSSADQPDIPLNSNPSRGSGSRDSGQQCRQPNIPRRRGYVAAATGVSRGQGPVAGLPRTTRTEAAAQTPAARTFMGTKTEPRKLAASMSSKRASATGAKVQRPAASMPGERSTTTAGTPAASGACRNTSAHHVLQQASLPAAAPSLLQVFEEAFRGMEPLHQRKPEASRDSNSNEYIEGDGIAVVSGHSALNGHKGINRHGVKGHSPGPVVDNTILSRNTPIKSDAAGNGHSGVDGHIAVNVHSAASGGNLTAFPFLAPCHVAHHDHSQSFGSNEIVKVGGEHVVKVGGEEMVKFCGEELENGRESVGNGITVVENSTLVEWPCDVDPNYEVAGNVVATSHVGMYSCVAFAFSVESDQAGMEPSVDARGTGQINVQAKPVDHPVVREQVVVSRIPGGTSYTHANNGGSADTECCTGAGTQVCSGADTNCHCGAASGVDFAGSTDSSSSMNTGMSGAWGIESSPNKAYPINSRSHLTSFDLSGAGGDDNVGRLKGGISASCDHNDSTSTSGSTPNSTFTGTTQTMSTTLSREMIHGFATGGSAMNCVLSTAVNGASSTASNSTSSNISDSTLSNSATGEHIACRPSLPRNSPSRSMLNSAGGSLPWFVEAALLPAVCSANGMTPSIQWRQDLTNPLAGSSRSDVVSSTTASASNTESSRHTHLDAVRSSDKSRSTYNDPVQSTNFASTRSSMFSSHSADAQPGSVPWSGATSHSIQTRNTSPSRRWTSSFNSLAAIATPAAVTSTPAASTTQPAPSSSSSSRSSHASLSKGSQSTRSHASHTGGSNSSLSEAELQLWSELVPQWLQAVLQLAASQWDQLPPYSLSMLLWAAARLKVQPDGVWVQQFWGRSQPVLARFSTQDLSNTIWAVTFLRVQPAEQWLASFKEAAMQLAGSMRPQHACLILWSFARLQLELPHSWLRAYLTAIVPLLSRFQPGDYAQCLWSLAALQHVPPSPWLSKLLDESLVQLPLFGHRDLSVTIWALAKVLNQRPLPRDWVDAFFTAASRQQASFSCQSAVNTGWAVAVLRPACDQSIASLWLHRWLQRCQETAAELSPGAACALMWTLFRLKCTPSQEWMQHVLQQVQPKLPHFCPDHLAVLLWGVHQSGYRPCRAWLQAFLAAAQGQLHAFPPKPASLIARALVQLDEELNQQWLTCFVLVQNEE